MTTLGDVLAAARRSTGALEAWLVRCDPILANDTLQAADRIGLGVAAYARMALADFARLAGDEDWASLISSLNKSEDAATTCLAAMVRWRINAPACHAHAQTEDRRSR